MEAVSWQEFEESAPDLAAFGRSRLEVGPAYLATTRRDGSPRVHPVTTLLREGLLGLYMYPSSPKGHDLRRDNRFALHSTVDDNAGTGGELAVRGLSLWEEDPGVGDRLTEKGIPPQDGYVRFELRLSRVLVMRYVGEGGIPELERWSVTDR